MKSSAVLCVTGIIASLIVSGAASAQSLKTIRAQEAEERALAREIAYTNSICDARIEARIDWRSVADWPSGSSLADACDGALGAVEAICRSSTGKQNVSSSIAGFVCAGDGDGASLSGATLRFGAEPGGNGFAETRSYLDGEL